MEKDFYTAKEIIMGTRSAYQKNEEYLRKLKDMVYSSDKEVKDFYFNVEKLLDYDPKMILNFIQNENTLRGLLWRRKLKYGTLLEDSVYLKEEDIDYIIKNRKYKAFIKEGMKKDFKLLMQEILNSDFVNNINSGHLYNEEQTDILLDIQQSLVAVRFNNYLSSSEEKNLLIFVTFPDATTL